MDRSVGIAGCKWAERSDHEVGGMAFIPTAPKHINGSKHADERFLRDASAQSSYRGYCSHRGTVTVKPMTRRATIDYGKHDACRRQFLLKYGAFKLNCRPRCLFGLPSPRS